MPKPLSSDLRQRVIDYVAQGHSARASASRFGVSESFAIKLVKRWREEGHARPRRFGRPPDRGKLRHCKAFLHTTLREEPDITLAELCERLLREQDVDIHLVNLSRYLRSLGYTYKKNIGGYGTWTRGCEVQA